MDTRTTDLANPDGSVLRIDEFPHNHFDINHRTESLDYGIVHSGNIICHLDNGEKVHAKAGDVVVQRGTIHAWETVIDECRMYFILLGAKPVKLANGKELGKLGYSSDIVSTGGK